MLFVLVALLAVGSTRDRGPLDPGDRVDDISRRIACPVCDGESVYESRNPASDAIRSAVRQAVAEGGSTDEQIIAAVAEAYGGQVLLVPRATGFDALVWALPVTAAVLGVVALGIAFRRWRAESAALAPATEDDYRLVAGALGTTEGDDRT
jgi:cytochrome c-type biogenesis protein CcmH